MADDVPLGAALTAAREQRGLSVEDVAAATRIRATIVRAIERDDFTSCGGAVYARGHLRAIAQVAGADPKPLVEEFDRRFDRPVPPLTMSPLPSFEPPRDAGRSGRQSPSWASAAVGVLAVAALFLVVSWVIGRDGGPGQPLGGGAGPVELGRALVPGAVGAPDPAAGHAEGVGRDAAAAGDRRGELGLGDQQRRDRGLPGDHRHGQARDFRDARQLSVRFGNSPAVRITQNGRDVGAPRCDTDVCTVSFGPAAAG